MIPGADTVTVLRGAARDNWGDRTGADASTDVAGCLVQPGPSVEQTDQGDLVVSNLTLFAPGGTDLLATDRVSWRGQVYEVNGSPDAWHDQAGAESHVQAQLKLVQGSD